jgi:hypothetical protein
VENKTYNLIQVKVMISLFLFMLFTFSFVMQSELKAHSLLEMKCESLVKDSNLQAVELSFISESDCHNSANTDDHESDCHCTVHRNFCCNALVLFKPIYQISILSIKSSLKFNLYSHFLKPAPFLDGPYQPPRV